ncbi:ribonucleases G and E [alpha proteobacterium Q-1]|uniref:cell envelope integrity protein TolA n=1 Tax=Iodidimonas nitroreducens TaxID=1236968 RepID=UPI00049F2BBB|nr:cell envelope integrity protein TolA [Iodidimonas nitroreducens]GAK32695.1 ribonucleases G and E [alpha proteobacterium Q-1]
MKKFYGEGLALSALVHLGLLAVIVFGLPRFSRPPPDMAEIVPVSFVEIADVTRTDAPQPEPEPEPEPAPEPEPEQAYAANEPAPAPAPADAVPLPQEKPAPEQEPKPEIKPAPEPKPTPPRARIDVAPRAKPRPPSRFDASKVAALIDRSIKEEAPPPQPQKDDAETQKEAERQKSITALSDRVATATLQAAIRQRVQECWYLPSGGKDVADMQVRIRIYLRQDGQLLRPPQFIDAGDMSGPGREFYRIFAESARRAVQNCEPYENLPLAQYDLWRQIDFTFDAADMLGG